MKFQVTGTDLNSILSTVIKGFNPKEDNSYIAFNLEETTSELVITSRSRATFFQGKVKAHSIEVEAGETTTYHLDGVKLKQLASILPTTPVNIEFDITEETRSFAIKTTTSKYKLPVLSATPVAPIPEYREFIVVDAGEFVATAKELIKIASSDSSAQEHQISCMHFKLRDNTFQLTATDAYAFGSAQIAASLVDSEVSEDFLIRHTEVNTLMGTFSAGETITIVGSDNNFGYIDENNTISLVGRINMNPLDTSHLESSVESINSIVINKNEFKTAIETVNKLSPGNAVVDLVIEEDCIVKVSNRNGDSIKIEVAVSELESTGQASFSTMTLLKALNPVKTPTLRVEMGAISGESTTGITNLRPILEDGTLDRRTTLLAIRTAE